MEQEDMELEGTHAEPRVYELGFHLDPELSQEEAKKAYQAIRDLVLGQGTIVAEGEIEKIPLAYTISRMETGGRRDFNSAYFGWVSYETTGAGHDEILSSARSNTKIIRFLDLRSSVDAAKHAAEMHEFYRKSPEALDAEDEHEEVAEAELDSALKEANV